MQMPSGRSCDKQMIRCMTGGIRERKQPTIVNWELTSVEGFRLVRRVRILLTRILADLLW